MFERARCRVAIHTHLFKKESTLSYFLKLTLRAQLFSKKIKIEKNVRDFFFRKTVSEHDGFSGSTMDLSEHDGTERTRCAELVR